MRKQKPLNLAVITLLAVGSLALSGVAVQAETQYKRVYDAKINQYVYVPVNSSQKSSAAKSLIKNPIVKQAAIGTAIGAGAGAISERSSVGRGAAIGAAAGAGSGLLGQSKYLEDKPLLRRSLQGAAVGTAASVVTRNNALKGAALGAGGGAAYHVIKKEIDKP